MNLTFFLCISAIFESKASNINFILFVFSPFFPVKTTIFSKKSLIRTVRSAPVKMRRKLPRIDVVDRSVASRQSPHAEAPTHHIQPACFLSPKVLSNTVFWHSELSGITTHHQMKLSLVGLSLSHALSISCAHEDSTNGHTHDNMAWSTLSITLPKGISDHTATAGSDGLIYIAGGCGTFFRSRQRRVTPPSISLQFLHVLKSRLRERKRVDFGGKHLWLHVRFGIFLLFQPNHSQVR